MQAGDVRKGTTCRSYDADQGEYTERGQWVQSVRIGTHTGAEILLACAATHMTDFGVEQVS